MVGGMEGGQLYRDRLSGTLHKDTGSSAVSLLNDRNRLNPQDRLKQLLAAFGHHKHPY